MEEQEEQSNHPPYVWHKIQTLRAKDGAGTSTDGDEVVVYLNLVNNTLLLIDGLALDYGNHHQFVIYIVLLKHPPAVSSWVVISQDIW